MSAKQIIKNKIIAIIDMDFTHKEDHPADKSVENDCEQHLYIQKNKKVINNCITEYIEEFGDEINENTKINEDWIREYLGEYCIQ